MTTRTAAIRTPALVTAVSLMAAACGGAAVDGGTDGGPGGDAPSGGAVRMARATWDTGWFQAAIYQQLIDELGYEVSEPADETRAPVTFYPALARGELDLWANGWFPLHEPFLEGELLTGQRVSEPIEPVGAQVPDGAVQGYLVDKASADEMAITSMDDFLRPEVADAFDQDGDGQADLYGCDEGWGCNVAIEQHIAQLGWGDSVEQVVGDYNQLMADAQARIATGKPTLYYTWTPNWTVGVLVPGDDVVWLESPALPGEEAPTEVAGLDGCAGPDPCQLGWVVNDIRAVGNTEFLDANPPVRRLLEVVQIPSEDIAAQNARMNAAGDYTDEDVRVDAAEWISGHRDLVDGWLETARGEVS